MPLDQSVPVLSNQDLGQRNFLLELDAPEAAASTRPAQFFMVGVPHSDVLLRRPFSVCGLPGTFDSSGPGRIQLLYKVVGSGTALLASLAPGAKIDLLGPLGQGFTDPAPGATPVFVAGGIGIAPFPALAHRLTQSGVRPILLYGARSAHDLPLLDWFRATCEDVVVSTDDGSLGTKGLVTESLLELLAGRDPALVHLYACGPDPMLRRVAAIARERQVTCDLSLEAHMACGFGVCLGCVVPTHTGRWGDGGYERVCVEGPVMRAERLAW
jgi:dihydroorotate dehydrogenase electron transfer subunit